jgi:hypothetical protein
MTAEEEELACRIYDEINARKTFMVCPLQLF